jgi:hypothetical protein
MNYFEVSQIFIDDLKDDFIMNHKLNLYEFIGGDVVKAFYLGLNIREWMQFLDKEQQYLHVKLLRHNKEGLDKYQSQIIYWINKYPKEEAKADNILTYLLNNMMFWDREKETEDMVRLALFFGIAETDAKNDKKQREESSGEH